MTDDVKQPEVKVSSTNSSSKELPTSSLVISQSNSLVNNETSDLNDKISKLGYDPKSTHKNGSIRHVSFTIAVERLANLNTVDQTFDAILTVQICWLPSKQDIINYCQNPSEYIPEYTPAVYVPNEASSERTLQMSGNQGYKILKSGEIDLFSFPLHFISGISQANYCVYFIRGTFVERLELESFPLDCQDLTITIGGLETIDNLIFVPTFAKNQDTVFISKTYSCMSEYLMHKPMVDYTTREFQSGFFYPYINVRIKIQRKYHTLHRIDDLGDRLAHCATMLLTAAAFQFTIASELPNIPYLTILDTYILFCFIYIFIVSFIVSLNGYLKIKQKTDIIWFWVLFASFFLAHGYFVCRCYVANEKEMKKLTYGEVDYARVGLGKHQDDYDYVDERFELDHDDIYYSDKVKERLSQEWLQWLEQIEKQKTMEVELQNVVQS